LNQDSAALLELGACRGILRCNSGKGLASFCGQRLVMGIIYCVLAKRTFKEDQQLFCASWVFAHCPQHIKNNNVTGAFPYRKDRLFPIPACQRKVLNVTIATYAFQSLISMAGAAYTDRVFGKCSGYAPKGFTIGRFVIVSTRPVHRCPSGSIGL